MILKFLWILILLNPSLANERVKFRIGILRHPGHIQSQSMFDLAINLVNKLGGPVELVPQYVNATATENYSLESSMYHEADDLCSRLCGVSANRGHLTDNMVALLSVAPHKLAFRVAKELGLPIITAGSLPAKMALPTGTEMMIPASEAKRSTLRPLLSQVLPSLAPNLTLSSPYSTGFPSLQTVTPDSDEVAHPPVRFMGPEFVLPMFSFVIHHQWLTFVYIAEGVEALERYETLKERLDNWSSVRNRFRLYLICLDQVSRSPTLLHSTKYLPTEDSFIVDRFVLDMSTVKRYNMLLMELKDLGMAAYPYEYYFVKTVISELDLSGFEKGGAVLYGFSIVSQSTPLYQTVARYWSQSDAASFVLPQNPTYYIEDGPMLSSSEALVFDQVFFIKTLLETILSNETTRELMKESSMHKVQKCGTNYLPDWCQLSYLSPHRVSSQVTADIFQRVTADGLTGLIGFDSKGRRRDNLLYLNKLELETALSTVSTLRSNGEWIGVDTEISEENPTRVVIVLNVTTIDSPPFLFVRNLSDNRQTTTPTDGSAQYVVNGHEFEGFCVDLAAEIGRILNIKFRFRHVKDGQYGAPDATSRKWNGMIGELIRGEADVAVAPLTITSTRERVVQMTKPILNTGISIMIKRPEKQQPGVFSFLEPLSSAIWVCTLFAYCGTAVCMWILCRLNNGEMVTPFRNSFWSALCALLGLGGEFSPKSFSGRLLVTVWFFFCLILISSYTANMTAFLTIEHLEVPIESAQDLVRQSKIQYGTLNSGSTKGFFMTSVNPLYRQMWEVMNRTYPSVFTGNVHDGVERVRNSGGRYAFLLESVMNAYYNQRTPCNTMQVGPLLDSKGYGIVTPLGSPYHAELNYAVLYLKEIGVVQQLVTKWWYDKGECPQDSSKKQDVSGALRLNNVTGVFFILIGGLVMGIILSSVEFIIASLGLARRAKIKFPIASSELLSGCILGSANKTVRPLHSLDLLARVLPWVEMPNISATMLLNRLDAISPRDPRRRYIPQLFMDKYSMPTSSSRRGILAANLEDERPAIDEDAVELDHTWIKPEAGTQAEEERKQKKNEAVGEGEGEGVVECSSESFSSVSSSTFSQQNQQPANSGKIIIQKQLSSASNTGEEQVASILKEVIMIQSPNYTEGMPGFPDFGHVTAPPILQLKPTSLGIGQATLEKHNQPISLYDMLTRGDSLQLSDSDIPCFKQKQWYEYPENDLTDL